MPIVIDHDENIDGCQLRGIWPSDLVAVYNFL